jgi:hypothetical protein
VRVVKVDSAKANKCWWDMYQLMQVPWLSYTSAQPNFMFILFRQHRIILKYRMVESAFMPTWPTWLGTPMLQGCARQKLVESHPLEGPFSGQQFNGTNETLVVIKLARQKRCPVTSARRQGSFFRPTNLRGLTQPSGGNGPPQVMFLT